MELFRISTAKRARSLSASGKENRWNKSGQFVIYAGTSRLLSTLELIVHSNKIEPTVPFKMMIIAIPDDNRLVNAVSIDELPANWRSIYAYGSLQNIGSLWYENSESLFLKVPSAVIPPEFNYLINVKHPGYNDINVKLVRTENYFWDERFLLRA